MNKDNLTLKIISVVFAMILWFVVTNIENPIATVQYEVPIDILNENVIKEKGLIALNQYEKKVEVSIRGRRDEIAKVKPDDFIVTLDFSEIATEGKKDITLSRPEYIGKQNITYWISGNKSFDMDLESTTTKTFDIEVETPGTPKESYSIANIEVIPETVTIKNLTSLMNTAYSAKVYIDVTGLDANKTYKEPLKVVDKLGNELNVLDEERMIDVKITVRKQVDLILNKTGKPGYDYYINDISMSPVKGYIVGPGDVLAGTDEIYTEMVDISGKTESIEGRVQFKLPEGLRLVDTTNYAYVKIDIRPIQYMKIHIPRSDINVDRSYIDRKLIYSITSEQVDMEVKGREQDLKGLDVEELSPHVSAPIKDGEYSLPLQVDLPENISIVTLGMVDVHVSRTDKMTIKKENISIINKNDAFEYRILQESVIITLIGTSDILDDINAEDLNLYIDVENLSVGGHKLDIEYKDESIKGVKLYNTASVDIKIVEKNQIMNQ